MSVIDQPVTEAPEVVDSAIDDPVIELLEETKRIVGRGWMKGQFCDTTHRLHCVGGALFHAGRVAHNPSLGAMAVLRPIGPPLTTAMAALNEVALRRGSPSLSSYNDKPETRKQDVFDLIDEAIALRQSQIN